MSTQQITKSDIELYLGFSFDDWDTKVVSDLGVCLKSIMELVKYNHEKNKTEHLKSQKIDCDISDVRYKTFMEELVLIVLKGPSMKTIKEKLISTKYTETKIVENGTPENISKNKLSYYTISEGCKMFLYFYLLRFIKEVRTFIDETEYKDNKNDDENIFLNLDSFKKWVSDSDEYLVSKIILETVNYYKEGGSGKLSDLFVNANDDFDKYINSLIDKNDIRKEFDLVVSDLPKRIKELPDKIFPSMAIKKSMVNVLHDNLGCEPEKIAVKKVYMIFWKFLYVLGRNLGVDKYNDRKKGEETHLNGIIENIYYNNPDNLGDFDITLYETKIKLFMNIQNNIKKIQKENKQKEKDAKKAEENNDKTNNDNNIIKLGEEQAAEEFDNKPDTNEQSNEITNKIDNMYNESENSEKDDNGEDIDFNISL